MGNIQRGVMSVLMMLALFSLCYLQQQLAGFWLAAGIASVLAIAVATVVAIVLPTSIAIVLAASIAIALAATIVIVLAIADDIGDKSISCRAVRPSDTFIVVK